MYSLGLTNSYAKNLVLLSYSDDPWIMSMFDMENAFGIRPDGLGFVDPSYCLPSCTEGTWDSGTGSLFWDRLLQCYEGRIRARYAQLREKLFTVPYIEKKLTALTGRIPEEYYAADRALYPEMLSEEDGYIITYLSRRLELLDALFLDGSGQ